MGSILPFDPAVGLICRGGPQTRNPRYFAVPQGLVGHWGFDPDCIDLAGNLALDLTGNGNNGALHATTLINGQVGTALLFNGSSGTYVLVADTALLRFSTNFTISFWFSTSNTTQLNKYLVARVNNTTGDQSSVIFGFVSTKIEFFAVGFTGTDPRTGSQIIIPDTNWHHIVYSYNGVTWAGYLDGVTVFSVARVFALSVAAFNGWYFAASAPTSNNAIAGLDEIQFRNRAIDPGEVMQIYQAGLAGRRDAGAWLPAECELPVLRASVLYPQLERGIRGLHRGVAQGSYR